MKKSYFGIHLTFVVGIALSLFIIKYSIGIDNIMTLFWEPKSMVLVLGGVIAATQMHFTDTQFHKLFSRLTVVFSMKAQHSLVRDVNYLADISSEIQAKGITAISSDIENCKDPFLKLGLNLLYDNVSADELGDLLKENIFYTKRRHFQGISFFQTMANYSPAFGLLGTVVGLIKLLSNLGDPEQFGHGMALAMVTTFYGLFFANFIFSPIAGRLQTLSDEEHMQKEMITIGLVSIEKNESTYLMKEKLQNFVSKKQRKKLWEK